MHTHMPWVQYPCQKDYTVQSFKYSRYVKLLNCYGYINSVCTFVIWFYYFLCCHYILCCTVRVILLSFLYCTLSTTFILNKWNKYLLRLRSNVELRWMITGTAGNGTAPGWFHADDRANAVTSWWKEHWNRRVDSRDRASKRTVWTAECC